MSKLYDPELQEGLAYDMWKNIPRRLDDQFQGGLVIGK